MGPSRRSSPIPYRASAENLRSQRSHALFQFQSHLIHSHFLSSRSHIALFIFRKVRKVCSYCSVLHASGSGFIFYFIFAEAGSHFISLITYLSLPLHIRKLLTNILLVYFSDLLHIHRSSRIWVGKIAVLYTCSAINFCGIQ